MLAYFFLAGAILPAAAALPSTFEVRRYEVVGNTLLTPEMLSSAFTNAIGPAVPLNQIFKGLAGLHRAYQERGFTGVKVAIPQQGIVNGVVTVTVAEGNNPHAAAHSSPASAIAKTTAPVTLEVRGYEVNGNTLLPPEVINPILASAVGKTVTLDQIRKAAGDLQLAYRERGFVTVSVNLPPQKITNATVKVHVTEGALAVVNILGNRYFSSNNIIRALPSLKTNAVLNGPVFQRELDLANANHDRLIYPTIRPGPDPGTSALELKVKDRLPLHGRFDLDNYSTPGSPNLRINAAAQYNNLWQLEHQIGLSYGFSPQEFKSGPGVPGNLLNRPLIAYYGGYYRMPFRSAPSVADEIGRSEKFGYDEASRQFRLPPAGARPDLTIYANASSSDTGVKLGRLSVVTNTPQSSIQSQDSGQNITTSELFGGRASVPVMYNDAIRFGISGGIDFKQYELSSYNTNNFYFINTFTNSQGVHTSRTASPSPQPARNSSAAYLPLALGADFSEKDSYGSGSANLSGTLNFAGDSAEFARAANSSRARAEFAKIDISFTREQTLPGEWSLLMRASAQVSPSPLIGNEQFGLGGLNSVRGYYEGESYGDSGWFAGIEARRPFLQTAIASFNASVPTWIRASVFMDYGQRFLSEAGMSIRPTESLWGVGSGVSANLNNRFDLRLAVGWPLNETSFSHVSKPHTYFTLGGQF